MNKKYKHILILLFLFTFICGLFWNQKSYNHSISGDEEIYNKIAQHLALGEGFPSSGEESTIEPIYPTFVAGVYKIFGNSLLSLQIIQIIMFALLSVVVFIFILKCNFDFKVALITSILVGLFYAIATEAGRIHKEILLCLTLLIGLSGLQVHIKNGSSFSLVISGVLFAIVAQISATMLVLPIFLSVGLWWAYDLKYTNREKIRFIFIFLTSFFVIFYFLGAWQQTQTSYKKQFLVPRVGFAIAAKAELISNLANNYPLHLLGHTFGYYFSRKIDSRIDPDAFRKIDDTKRDFYSSLKNQNDVENANKEMLKKGMEVFISKPHWYVGMFFLDWISLNSPLVPKFTDLSTQTTIHQMFAYDGHGELSDLQKSLIVLSIRIGWYLFLFLVLYGLFIDRRNKSIALLFSVILYFNLFFPAIRAIPRYALPIYPLYFMFASVATLTIWNRSSSLISKKINIK